MTSGRARAAARRHRRRSFRLRDPAAEAASPVGAAIAISVANDTVQTVFLATLCPFRVRNEGGGGVFTPKCFQARLGVEPGSVFTAMWDQVDDAGHPVPPGTYLVDVFFAGGT